MAGAVLALPMLLTLAILAAPFAGTTTVPDSPAGALAALPLALWMALPGLPAAASAIGFLTAQGTVRWWLRRLP
jgi:cell division transport system permease protein